MDLAAFYFGLFGITPLSKAITAAKSNIEVLLRAIVKVTSRKDKFMIISNIEDLDRYAVLSKNIKTAIKFLKSLNPDQVKPGRMEVDGNNVWATCYEYQADGVPGAQFENHKHHLDVHLTLAGTERMAISDVDHVKIIQPYDSENDITLYTGEPKQIIKLVPNTILFCFPEDFHQPKVRYNDASVKKLVLKVRV